MTRHAMFVGVDEYHNIGIPNLRSAVADASELAEVFQRPGPYRINRDNVVLLTDARATREAVLEAIKNFKTIVRPEDIFLFYFAGHGCSERDHRSRDGDELRKFIAVWDTDPDHLHTTGIDFHLLTDHLHDISAGHQLSIFDCCYSGAANGRTFSSPGSRSTDDAFRVGTRYLERLSGNGRLVMTACTGREVALEKTELGHGVFTHAIIEALRGKGDFRGDGAVDCDELWMYAVEATAAESGEQQHPVRAGWTEGSSLLLTTHEEVHEDAEFVRDIQRGLTRKFKGQTLRQVLLAPSESAQSLGERAARYLDSALTSNSRIAVSCGRTLAETVARVSCTEHENVDVYPLNGAPSEDVHFTDATVLSLLLWSRFEPDNAVAHILPTGVPEEIFADIKQKIASLAEDILTNARDADLFLFGIGEPTLKNKNIPSFLQRAGLSITDLERLGVAGEINFHLYDESGVLLPLKGGLSEEDADIVRRYTAGFLALPATDLKNVAENLPVETVVVAGGVGKREAIAAAIVGGFVRTLITDVHTARWLLEDYRIPAGSARSDHN